MKNAVQKLLVLSVAVSAVIATTLHSQSARADQVEELTLVRFTKNLPLITDKFEGTEAASVRFDAKSLQITLKRRGPSCDPGTQCVQLVPPLEVIDLQVLRVVREQCSDIYYAQTGASAKSALLEQVVLESRVVSRCATIAPIEDKGDLFYRVSGISKATGEKGEAQIHFSLGTNSTLPTK